MANTSELNAVAVIPARYESSRFPGKPLAPIAGLAMIQRVYERTKQAKRIARVIVATDDTRIADAVKSFGGEAMMTRKDHHCGTERAAEIAAHVSAAIYLNVQGDEPLIDPEVIDALVVAMEEDAEIHVATPCSLIRAPAEIMDPNVVKAVIDFDGNALYFSRAPIPWVRDTGASVAARHWKHIGLYAFRHEALLDFPTLPPGELERVEQLEQLRWLENGYKIRIVESEYDAVSVDVPADVPRVEKILSDSGLS
ncbi:MAG: 3-deoxy-manno-octulosonate cytidylyltransferase [Candidatus Acidiferrales bacterium]|jgi:3-deoxy-manno-octulosonate cytidylyltransferase (CMP-KDO synthetase)